MTDDLAKILARYIEKKKLKLDDYLFNKWTTRTIQNAVKRYAKIAGIKKNVVFHNFRHNFVTQLAKRGWTPYQIIQLTGHANIGGLNPYSHMVLEDVKEEALKTLKDI
jgi:integrase/recombinase XerD